MALSLEPDQLRRYRDIVRLLVKYGRADEVRAAGLDDVAGNGAGEPGEEVAAPAEEDDARPARAEALAADLERMGPTFIKAGQLLSTRPDLLPPDYLDALSRLQDDVEPFAPDEAKTVIEEELGAPVTTAFRDFQEEPLAVASLGQVHYAELRDGRPVAVKVQRPGIRQQIAGDMEAVAGVAQLLARHTDVGEHYDLPAIVEEFRQSLQKELDYRLEANNLTQLARSLRDFRDLVVPRPVEGHSTARVLTMEYVAGRKLTDLDERERREIDGGRLADQLFEAYLQQTLVDGFFHADPHPGNLLITDEGDVSLLDLGMVGRITPRMQERLLRLILAISEGKGEDAAEVAMGLGEPRAGFDRTGFVQAVSRVVGAQQGASLGDIQVGRVVMSVTRISTDNGIRVPAELTLLGKTLLNLDEAGRLLDPEFDPNEAVRRHAADILRKRMLKQASPGNLLSSALELNEFLQRLPTGLNQALDRLTGDELELKVDVFDEVRMMQGIQKIANRITMGLVLAALIVSAAMLMRVETDFTIFGYPGFAMLLFLAAVGGGVLLLIDILRHDEKLDRRSDPRS